MSDLLLYLIKANVALVLFCLGYYLLLRKLTFYGINRYYLIFALLFSALYPSIPMDGWFVPNQDTPTHLLFTLSDWQHLQLPQEANVESNSFSIAYWISIGFFGLLLLIKLMGIGRIHLRSVPARWGRFVYRKSKENIAPFSFWTNIYFNPLLYTEAEYEKIFSHEQVHVRQLHSLDILLAEIALIFFWYNPFYWLIRRAIQENIEFITDQRILSLGIDKKSYQYSLVQISTSSHPSYLGNHFNFKNLKKRIIMMNKKQSSKMQLGKYVFIIPAIVLGSLILSVSKANNEAQTVEIRQVPSPVFSDTLRGEQDGKYRIVDAERHIADPEIQTPQSSYIVREAEIITISPDTPSDKDKKTNPSPGHQDTVKTKDPLFIVDGVKQLSLTIDVDQIESVNVIKDKAATSLYGEESQHGVIIVTTKKAMQDPLMEGFANEANKPSVNISTRAAQIIGYRENNNEHKEVSVIGIQSNKATSLQPGNIDDNLLIFVDGKKLAKGALDQINPNDIESISVFKGENAIERYGAEGKDGVIEIITKGKN